MMFEKILATLDKNGKSGLAYGKAIKLAEKAMNEDPDRATGYLLLKVLADRFIETTGRLPVTAVQTENAFKDFSKHLNSLSQAYASGDSKMVSAALNKVSVTILEPFDPSFPVIE